MWTLKAYLFMMVVLMILLAGVSSLSCACSPSTGPDTPKVGALSQDITEKGDPEWWKKQPDLKKEETSINETIINLRTAFIAKDTEKALSYFAPDDKEKFKAIFSKSPDVMPQIAKDLENTTLNFLSLDTDNTLDRVAEYAMKVDGNTFYIIFIKIDGKWLIKYF